MMINGVTLRMILVRFRVVLVGLNDGADRLRRSQMTEHAGSRHGSLDGEDERHQQNQRDSDLLHRRRNIPRPGWSDYVGPGSRCDCWNGIQRG